MIVELRFYDAFQSLIGSQRLDVTPGVEMKTHGGSFQPSGVIIWGIGVTVSPAEPGEHISCFGPDGSCEYGAVDDAAPENPREQADPRPGEPQSMWQMWRDSE